MRLAPRAREAGIRLDIGEIAYHCPHIQLAIADCIHRGRQGDTEGGILISLPHDLHHRSVMQQDLEAVTAHRDRIVEMLNGPLDRTRILTRQGRGGNGFSYLATHDVIDKLNEIFGYDGWKDHTRVLDTIDGEGRTWKSIVDLTCNIGGEWIEKSGEGFAVKVGNSDDAIETAMKGAASDALKRAARKFGTQFGNSLYSDDPTKLTAESIEASGFAHRVEGNGSAPRPAQPPRQQYTPADDVPACDRCGGPMWDNRAKKASGEYAENRPDFTCKDRDNCKHAVWLNSNRPQRGDSTQNRQPSTRHAPNPAAGNKPVLSDVDLADMQRLAQLIWGGTGKGWDQELRDYTWEHYKVVPEALGPNQAKAVIASFEDAASGPEGTDVFDEDDRAQMERRGM